MTQKRIIDVSYFAHARIGLFTHYTYATYAEGKGTNWGGTWFSQENSRGAESAEEAAACFDGERFARTAHDLGAEYVVFTVAHAGFNLLFPSETMKKTGCFHKCAEKSDAIAKLLDGLAPYDIPLVLYMPPNDDHDIPGEDLEKMGWTSQEARMEFLKRLIGEIHVRYGGRIAGYWFDQSGPTKDVCDTVRQYNPHAVVFVNTGITANTQKHPLSDILVSEYYGSIEAGDSDHLPTHYSQVNRQIGNWWATGGSAPTDARSLYRYTVRTIATSGQQNAGIAWSCGPYLDQSWETGVRELLSEMGSLFRSHEGIYGTVPGIAYPEEPNALLTPDRWGVSTELADRSVVYLHVLNRPDDGILRLPPAADGRTFTRARRGDQPLSLEADSSGYRIALPADWDGIDQVICLE